MNSSYFLSTLPFFFIPTGPMKVKLPNLTLDSEGTKWREVIPVSPFPFYIINKVYFPFSVNYCPLCIHFIKFP